MYLDDIAIIIPENPPLLKPYTTTIGTIKRVPTAMILLHDTHVAFPGTSIFRFPVKSAPGQIVRSQIGPKSKRPQNESQIGHIFQIELKKNALIIIFPRQPEEHFPGLKNVKTGQQ
jgi:hypothetical protein